MKLISEEDAFRTEGIFFYFYKFDLATKIASCNKFTFLD